MVPCFHTCGRCARATALRNSISVVSVWESKACHCIRIATPGRSGPKRPDIPNGSLKRRWVTTARRFTGPTHARRGSNCRRWVSMKSSEPNSRKRARPLSRWLVPSTPERRRHYESASCRSARPGVPLVGRPYPGLWTLHLHGLRLAVAAPDCVDSEWGLLAEATPPAIHCHGAALHPADQGNTATIAADHRTGIQPTVKQRRVHRLLAA